MTKQKRTGALLLAAVLCFALLFSAFFIGIEAHHDCTGVGCAICDCIRLCENTLKAAASALAAAVSLFAVMSAFPFAQEAAISRAPFVTLISLKVKLSD